MAEALTAHASVLILAPRAMVWDALIRPETFKDIMPVTDVSREWRPGRPFVWKVDMLGRSYDLEGTVLRFETGRALEYEYLDPLSTKFRENRHRVTIELAEQDMATSVSVLQTNNMTRAALAHAEGGWRLALNNLKSILEAAR